MFTVGPGEKFALLTLSTNTVEKNISPTTDCGNGYWAMKDVPVQLSDHWKEWLGSLRTKEVGEADLIIAVKGRSNQHNIQNDEDEGHSQSIGRFLLGLMISGPLRLEHRGLMLRGFHDIDEPRIRSFNEMRHVLFVPGTPLEMIDTARLKLASRLAQAQKELAEGGKHSRLFRSVNAFFRAIESDDESERLHQHCRSIEGLINPRAGNTGKQFKSRTETFIGPRHHLLMEQIYSLRNAAEHLHSPLDLISGPDERSRRVEMMTRCLQIEAIARHCLLHVLTTPDLWGPFEDGSIDSFWQRSSADQGRLWGKCFDIDAFTSALRFTYVQDWQLGIRE